MARWTVAGAIAAKYHNQLVGSAALRERRQTLREWRLLDIELKASAPSGTSPSSVIPPPAASQQAGHFTEGSDEPPPSTSRSKPLQTVALAKAGN